MVRVMELKAQFAAQLTQPAFAALWGSKVGGSCVLPASMLVEAAAAAAFVTAATVSAGTLQLQGLAIHSSMNLDFGNQNAASGALPPTLHVELDMPSGATRISSAGGLHLTAAAAATREVGSRAATTSRSPIGPALGLLAGVFQRFPAPASDVALVTHSSASFQDGFCTHPGQAEAMLTLAAMSKGPVAQSARALTACSAIILKTPGADTAASPADQMVSTSASMQQAGHSYADCCMHAAPGMPLKFASAAFAMRPIRAGPSGLGLRLLWKPVPVAPLAPQARHHRWLLICTQPIGAAGICEARAGIDGAGAGVPEMLQVVLQEDKGSTTGTAAPSGLSVVSNEVELQALIKRVNADHCFIVQPSSTPYAGECRPSLIPFTCPNNVSGLIICPVEMQWQKNVHPRTCAMGHWLGETS